jgi:hypothetical protein
VELFLCAKDTLPDAWGWAVAGAMLVGLSTFGVIYRKWRNRDADR